MSLITAVIAGASGLVGGHCLSELLLEPAIGNVIALARRPLLVQSSSKFSFLQGDPATIEELPPMRGGAFFCTLGTTIRKAGSQEEFRRVDHDLPLRLAKLAQQAGAASALVVSSVGADSPGSNFYLTVKNETERDLTNLNFSSLHIFRPSLILGERAERRAGERIAIAVSGAVQFLLVGGLRKYRSIAAQDVAKAMVRAAVQTEPGRHVYHFDEMQSLLHRA